MNAGVGEYEFARAMREDRGRFAALRHARVAIYWPHGLGDWTHLGVVMPLLEPSNAYAVMRLGDDYSATMEGTAGVTVLRSGVATPSDGAATGVRHLGLNLRKLDGRRAKAALPPPLDTAVREFKPDTLLWTDYPETEGRSPYPFHTKARHLARLLVRPERLAEVDLSQPLRNAIDFLPLPQSQRRLDERLRPFAAADSRVCVISRRGVTAARKNWGDGSQARTLVEMLRREDRRWRIVSMDDEPLGDGVAGFRALFAGIGEPFARVYKALMARTSLFVGVPAGPLHLTMARGGISTVGLWLTHHPDWYDEPNPQALHLVGRYVRDRGFDRRAATTTKPPSLQHGLRYLDTRYLSPEVVFEACHQLT